MCVYICIYIYIYICIYAHTYICPKSDCVQIEKLFAKYLACTLQKCSYSKRQTGTSLVVYWLRICFPTQGTQVQSQVGELRSTCCGATKPSHCNYWTCPFHSRASVPLTAEPTCPGAWVPQLERSLWGVRNSPRKELLYCNKDPAWCN